MDSATPAHTFYVSRAGFVYWAIDIPRPFLNSIVPAVGFMISTFTMPWLKAKWIEKNHERSMEKIYNVKLDVSCQAYGKFAGTKAKPLVIVVHGLPCTINEGIYERACEHFQQAGYATYRFGLYDWHKDARQLIDCTLITHAKDLDTVVAHFRENGFKKIFVAGHSFGGPTILLSTKQDFDAAVLWDPSYDISVIKKSMVRRAGSSSRSVERLLHALGCECDHWKEDGRADRSS